MIEIFRITFTANAKRTFVPRDLYLPFIKSSEKLVVSHPVSFINKNYFEVFICSFPTLPTLNLTIGVCRM